MARLGDPWRTRETGADESTWRVAVVPGVIDVERETDRCSRSPTNDMMEVEPRRLALLFRLRFLQELALGRGAGYLRELGLHVDRKVRVQTLFESAYRVLVDRYPCEYVVKNELVTRLLHELHPNGRSSLTSEFKLGPNRADLLVVNGTTTAYEIKTRYDVLDRLPRQIASYQRVFDHVVVVCDAHHLENVDRMVPRSVGITLYDDSFHVHREPGSNLDAIDPGSVFDLLRVPEYTAAIRRLRGVRLDVPNTRRYRAYRAIFSELSPHEAHQVLKECLFERFALKAPVPTMDRSLTHLYLDASPKMRSALFSESALLTYVQVP